jgi:hypothetical protein
MKLICLKTNTLRFDTDQKIFHVIERQLLKILINYYRHHLDGFKEPKSLDVLKEVFLDLFRLSLRIIENHCRFFIFLILIVQPFK